MNHLTPEETRQAVRLGVARAMSESGLTPSQAEAHLSRFSIDKSAGVLEEVMNALKGGAFMALAGGGLAGAYAGKLHHQMDRAVAGENDPEVSSLRRKSDAYHKMTADLALEQNATRPIAPQL